MKRFNLKKAAAAFLALASAAVLTGCGATPTAGPPVGNIPGGIIGPGGCAQVAPGVAIPFTMNGVAQLAADRAAAGLVPSFQTAPFGQVVLGGATAITPNQNSIFGFRVPAGPIGGSTVMINATSPTSGVGVLTLSAGDAQLIAQYGNCISGLGLMMRYSNITVNPNYPQVGPMHHLILDSVIYLFMNGNTTAFPLEF